MKKAAMIIASENFRDEELLRPKEILEKNGVEVIVACTSLSSAKGVLGAKVTPNILISDINVKEFAAVVFIGGAGASQYWNDPLAYKLIQDALNAKCVVAAICIAPVTLAKAGILKGKRATVFSSEIKQLQGAGAIYTGSQVEKDGNIITASGPAAAVEFGQEIVRALNM